jgi:pentatricopeptide repeat domain (PPR motif)
LRLVILKSIQKSNTTFATEVFEEMIQHQIIPDDATYSTLIEALLADGYTDDAFELYIQASFCIHSS